MSKFDDWMKDAPIEEIRQRFEDAKSQSAYFNGLANCLGWVLASHGNRPAAPVEPPKPKCYKDPTEFDPTKEPCNKCSLMDDCAKNYVLVTSGAPQGD